jgi:hypothetical protein
VSDRVVEVLSLQCTKLRRLSLAENPITDRALALINPTSFPDLAALVLRRCTELTSAAIATLATGWQAVTGGGSGDGDDDYFKQEMAEDEADSGQWPVPVPAIGAPDAVRKTRGIEELDLWGVNVYDHALMAIAASLPHLSTLWLGETSVSDEGLHALAQSTCGLFHQHTQHRTRAH